MLTVVANYSYAVATTSVWYYSGRQFNEQGVVENWWSNASLSQFTSRTQCFVDQYNAYTLVGQPVLSELLLLIFMTDSQLSQVNGVITLNENIPDSAGITVAYQVLNFEY